MEFLELSDVLNIHHNQVELYGGDFGVRDLALLESAIAQPRAMFDGRFLHSDVFEMAAAYLFHIVKNHPFFDGNKRTGVVSTLVFLEWNGVDLDITDDELVATTLKVVTGKIEKPALADFFRAAAK